MNELDRRKVVGFNVGTSLTGTMMPDDRGGVSRRGCGNDRPPGRLRSAQRQGRVERRSSRGVERRHDDHGRQPRVPGHQPWPFPRLCRRYRKAIARPRHAVGDRQRAVDLPRERGPVYCLPDEQGRRFPARRGRCGGSDAQDTQHPAPRRAEARRYRQAAGPVGDNDAGVEPAAAVRHGGAGRRGQGQFRTLLHRLSRRQRDRQRFHPRPARIGHAGQRRCVEIGRPRRRAEGTRHGQLCQGLDPAGRRGTARLCHRPVDLPSDLADGAAPMGR